MSELQTPSIFESFNARALTPAQIAPHFVPQEHYERLVGRRHSLLIGPRGSGKTTLLKMLQPEALEIWSHSRAAEYRARVDFTGVFVATDVSWGHQREALGDGKLDQDSHELLSRSLFTTHVFKSLIAAIEFRSARPPKDVEPYRRFTLSPDQQAEFVRSLAREWHIGPKIPSLLALRHALLDRLSQIRQLASKEALLGEEGRAHRLSQIDFIHIHFVDAISNATTYCNDLVGEPKAKWAFLFDELEIAPPWIYEQVVSAIRSVDDKILFKLAVSPVSSPAHLKRILNTAGGPSSLDDYDPIPLWYAEKEEAFRFCSELWASMLRERNMPPKSPDEVLGTAYSDAHRGDRASLGSAYHPQGQIGKAFIELASKDRSFQEYLSQKNIDASQLNVLPPEKMDQVVRKIAPVVMVRNFFRRAQTSSRKRSRRTRKVPAIYAGADSMFAITEGNPRWFIGIIGSLLDRAKADQGTRVSESEQVHRVEHTANRFMARLRAIPVSRTPTSTRDQVLSVDQMLKRIGEYFEYAAIVDTFAPEPPLVFRVSPEIPRPLRENLDKAANAGAIMYLPDSQGGTKDLLLSVSDKRFRLSYLLAPLYHLPLRIGPEVLLSKILSAENRARDFFHEDPGVP